MDDDNDLFEGLDDDIDGLSGSDSDEGQDAPGTDGAQDGADKAKKRTREDDLMSKWQSEQAKNERLQKELVRLQGTKSTQGAVPPEVQQWMDAAKDAARERFYETDPRLAEYGIPASAITGNTPDEMRASVKGYRDLIDSVETKARNKVLAEHGIVAESVGSSRFDDQDLVGMSDKDFDKLVNQVTGGRF